MASGTIMKGRKLLWSGNLSGTTAVATLSEPYTNYDLILILWKAAGVYERSIIATTKVDSFADGLLSLVNSQNSIYYASIETTIVNGTNLRITYDHKTAGWGSDNAVTAVYGIR